MNKVKKTLPLLILVVIVSLFALTYYSLSDSLDDYHFTQQELYGAKMHSELYRTLQLATNTKRALRAYPTQKNIAELKANLKTQMHVVDLTLQKTELTAMYDDWEIIKQQLAQHFLKPNPPDHHHALPVQQTLAQEETLSQLLALMFKVTHLSNMVLDPDMRSYQTMLLFSETIPSASRLIHYWQTIVLENESVLQSGRYQTAMVMAYGELERLTKEYQMLEDSIQDHQPVDTEASNYKKFNQPSGETRKPKVLASLATELESFKKIAVESNHAQREVFLQASEATFHDLLNAYSFYTRSFNGLLEARIQKITQLIAVISVMALLAALACVIFMLKAEKEALKQVETGEYLEALYNTVKDALIVVNEKGKIRTVNPAACDIFGYSKDELLGRPVSMLFSTHDYQHFAADLKTDIIAGYTKLFSQGKEISGFHRNGSHFPILISVNQTVIDGERMGVALMQDISTRKSAELASLEQKQQMQQLIHNQNVATFLIDAKHRVAHWNLACEELTGVKASEILGSTESWRAFYAKPRPCLADLVLDQLEKKASLFYASQRQSTLLETGWHAERWFERLGGKKRYVIFDASPIFDAKGNITAVVETLQDITEAKLLEQAFSNESYIAQQALKSLEGQKYALDQHALVTRKNREGKITYANEKICKMTGYTENELMGSQLEMLDSGLYPQKFYDEMYRTVREGDVWQGEVCYRNKDGGLFWLDSTIVPILGDDGLPEEYIAIRTDITASKMMELELRQAYANLEEFTAVASHDLKSPIRGIADLINWISEDLGDDIADDVKNNLDRVKVRVKRMEQLIEDLLLYARAGKKHAETSLVDPVMMVQDTIDLISPPAGFTVKVTGTAKLFNTTVTPLQTCLRNLISNAIKHHDQTTGNVEVHISQNKSQCVFTVKDDGPGIPEAAHERVFKLFQTLSKTKDSTGLGLAVSKRMIEAHGGRIELEENKKARGTTFRVYWPLVGQTLKTRQEAEKAASKKSAIHA